MNTPANILYLYKYIYWEEMKNYVNFIKKLFFQNV